MDYLNLPVLEEIPLLKSRKNELIQQLEAFNQRQNSQFSADQFHFGYFIEDPQSKRLLGGLVGWLWMGSMNIHRFWVDEIIKNHHYGSTLLEKAELFARSRGCRWIVVETLSFQEGLSFYLKHGFKIAYHDEGYSSGMSIYHLRKQL